MLSQGVDSNSEGDWNSVSVDDQTPMTIDYPYTHMHKAAPMRFPGTNSHKWFYIDRQRPEKVIVFKSYDLSRKC